MGEYLLGLLSSIPDLPFDGVFRDVMAALQQGRFADLIDLFGGGPIFGQLFDGDILDRVRDLLDGPNRK